MKSTKMLEMFWKFGHFPIKTENFTWMSIAGKFAKVIFLFLTFTDKIVISFFSPLRVSYCETQLERKMWLKDIVWPWGQVKSVLILIIGYIILLNHIFHSSWVRQYEIRAKKSGWHFCRYKSGIKIRRPQISVQILPPQFLSRIEVKRFTDKLF